MAEPNGNRDVFDPGQQHVAKVYAKALLGATAKSGNTEVVLEELDSLVRDVLDRLVQLDATLRSPRVAHEDKMRILEKAFRRTMCPELLNFLKVVVRHDRFDCLRAIRRAAWHLYNIAQGRVEVELRTAEPIDDQLRQTITSRLRSALGREVVLSSRVDADLIGGLVVQVGDTVYDGSLANQLLRMRAVAVDRTVQQIRQALDRFALAD